MRLFATLLLVLMTAIFIATTIVKVDWPWVPYVRAFAEAGMVGACADWFAIVALFRRPLGLPIPHTGIVPNNKDRIGQALGNFITNNFLTVGVMNERLARIDMVGALGTMARANPPMPNGSGDMSRCSCRVSPRRCRCPASANRSAHIASTGRASGPGRAGGVEAAGDTVGARRSAGAAGVGDRSERSRGCANNKEVLTDKVSQQSSRWIPKWVDRMIADKVLNGLLGTLHEMRDHGHPWRLELRKTVEKMIADLATDPHMRTRAEEIKAELLASPLVIEQAKTLWAEVESGLIAGVAGAFGSHRRRLARGRCAMPGGWLQEDEARKAQLNRRIRIVGQRFLSLYRVEIGAYIERVVRNWDTATLVDRLELQVGKDLQYIRINGTLVGGLVGLLIFTVSQWIALF